MDLKVAINYFHYKLNPKLLKKDNIYYKLKKDEIEHQFYT